MTLPFDATEHLRDDGAQLIDAVGRAGFGAPVPSCPGWSAGDLAYHVGQVWTFWSWVVSERVTDSARLVEYRTPPRLDDDVLLDWVTAAHTGLYAVLTDTHPDTEVWTWTGAPQDALWVRRRMAHETAVHRWDAEALVGDPYDLPVALAADGIDEHLQWFAPAGSGEPIAGTVHLHCTDTDRTVNEGSDDISAVGGEWMVHGLRPGAIEVERAHGTADAAVRGRASDLLLWLWGRQAGPVEILGDGDLARRFRDFAPRN